MPPLLVRRPPKELLPAPPEALFHYHLTPRATRRRHQVGMCSAADCPPRDQGNLGSLLAWTARTKPVGYDRILAFELGNELNSVLNGSAGDR